MDGEDFIQTDVCPKAGDVILDLGCGTGELSAYLAELVGPRGKVIGVDPDKERVCQNSPFIPTKLGVILFTVMTNKLLSDWRLRIKYVDDTSALEIISRNSPSLLNVVASYIHNFAIAHNMRLNPTKCKEMHINVLRNSN